MDSVDNVYQEIEKVLANQQINQDLLTNLENRIIEFSRKINSVNLNGLDGNLKKQKSSFDDTGDKLHEISLNDQDSTQQKEEQKLQQQLRCLNDKQIQKLVSLTNNDQNRFSKSYICGRVMLMCFENELIQIANMENIRLIINLINSLCNLIDKLNGLDLCFQLGIVINNILNYLINQADLTPEYKDYMNRMKQNPIINGSRVACNFTQYERRISQIAISDDFSQKKQAVNLIFDLFSECISYSEQMTLFSYSITNILKDIVRIPVRLNEQEEEVKTLMVLLAKFVLTLLVIPETQIEFDPKIILKHIQDTNKGSQDQNANCPIEYFFHSKDNFLKVLQKQGTKTDRYMGNVINYNIKGIKEVITQSEHIYGNIALIVNSLLLFPNEPEIMRYCLGILKNLYKQFLNFRKKLESPIMTVFQNIINLNDSECEQSAAIFLYELINNPQYEDDSFIDLLNSNEKIKQIKSSQYFNSKFVSCTPFNKQIFKFEDLVIHKTFAMQQTIEAEKSYSYHLEIKKPFSIVYVGFATQSNDIKVTFQKLDDFGEGQIIQRQDPNVIQTFLSQRINCEQDPYRLVLLAEKKGIYKIEFDNSYSWYNSKLLRFRCLLLEPEISDRQIIRQKLLFDLLKFDQLDLLTYKSNDENYCQLYILNNSIEISIETSDKQIFKKLIKPMDFKEINRVILEKFKYFTKQDYLGILVVYEQTAWTDLINHYAWSLVSEGHHSQNEVDQRRRDKSFQNYLIQRYLQENLSFIYQFKSLSLETIEDTNYLWFKNGLSILKDQTNEHNNNNTSNHQNNQINEHDRIESSQVILISKSNPSSKVFQLKLFQDNLHLIQLEDLDDDVFEQYEHLMKLSDSEEYFTIYCEFMKKFLIRHSSYNISKIVIYVDPSNTFWNDNQIKVLKSFFETQLPSGIKVPTLIKQTI